jgi:hypothetical protein
VQPNTITQNTITHTTEEHKQKYRLGLDGKSYILRLTDTSGMIPLDSLTKEVRFAFLSPQFDRFLSYL